MPYNDVTNCNIKIEIFQYSQEKYFIKTGVITMKKRISQTNIQVKQDMYKALLRLMGNKLFSSIAVSDITSEAGVSRMSFYRNYNAIEDILTEHLEEVVEEYRAKELEEPDTGSEKVFYEKKYMLRCFRFFYLHREFIDALITAGMGDLFLAKITEHLIRKWVDKEKETREETLRISAFAGAIYNMYREWSKGDFLELPEDVAAILYDLRKQTD
jgi:AcrR family transcriptional regulator|nr:TetR/AcrR family transcriptional regulator [uncultured Blautia sp.]